MVAGLGRPHERERECVCVCVEESEKENSGGDARPPLVLCA